MRKVIVVLLTLAAFALAAPAVLADALFPELDVYTYDQSPGILTTLDLDVAFPSSQQYEDTIAITAPTGYGLALSPVGTSLGDAEVDVVPAAGGASTAMKGSAVVSDPAAFAADPQTATCAPGAHTATWSLNLGSTTIPIAVDQLTSGGSYRLTVCLGALRAASLKPTDIFFKVKDTFRNPAAAQTYWWTAVVTPDDGNGAPVPTSAFELQAGEPIPEILTVQAAWNAKKHLLTTKGTLIGGKAPRPGIHVHVYAGASGNYLKMHEIGFATTNSSGSYVFSKRFSLKPLYVYSHVNTYNSQKCTQPATAPAGCLGWSIDGADSWTVKTH